MIHVGSGLPFGTVKKRQKQGALNINLAGLTCPKIDPKKAQKSIFSVSTWIDVISDQAADLKPAFSLLP